MRPSKSSPARDAAHAMERRGVESGQGRVQACARASERDTARGVVQRALTNQRGVLVTALGFAGCSMPSYDRSLCALRMRLCGARGLERGSAGGARRREAGVSCCSLRLRPAWVHGVGEADVLDPSAVARFTLTRSCAPQLRISVTSGWLTFFTRAWAVFPPAVVKGRPVTTLRGHDLGLHHPLPAHCDDDGSLPSE
jgi:hypothetical protein